jgi:hypothetical protein
MVRSARILLLHCSFQSLLFFWLFCFWLKKIVGVLTKRQEQKLKTPMQDWPSSCNPNEKVTYQRNIISGCIHGKDSLYGG